MTLSWCRPLAGACGPADDTERHGPTQSPLPWPAQGPVATPHGFTEHHQFVAGRGLIFGYPIVLCTVIFGVLGLIAHGLVVRVIERYQPGLVFRLGRVTVSREPGLRLLIPIVDVLHRVSLRIVTDGRYRRI